MRGHGQARANFSGGKARQTHLLAVGCPLGDVTSRLRLVDCVSLFPGISSPYTEVVLYLYSKVGVEGSESLLTPTNQTKERTTTIRIDGEILEMQNGQVQSRWS